MGKRQGPRRLHREFIAAIRTELDAAGATRIRVDRSWLRTNAEGEAFLLEAPVGPEMVVPLRPGDSAELLLDEASCEAEAKLFAKALINLDRGKQELLTHAEAVRAAVRSEVLVALEGGTSVRLAGVRFKPTRVNNLEDPDSACDHVFVEVDIETTSPNLGRQTTSILVEEMEDIASLLRDEFDHQRSRQARLEELAALEADLEIDDIGLELLRWPTIGSGDDLGRQSKLDPGEVLDELLRDGSVTIKLTGGQVLYVHNDCGVAQVTMTSSEANWSGQYLWLSGPRADEDHSDRVGRTLEGLLHNPIFANRKVEYASQFEGTAHQLFSFNNPRRWLYDAQTGHLRQRSKLSA